MSKSRLIVGLGNPEKKYEGTRHNLGFLVLRALAEELNFKFTLKDSLKSLLAHGEAGGKKVLLLMPLTYVNNSGTAVRAAVTTKNIALSNLLVICDDLNLDFGQLRIRPNGSDGGHNGLTSIISHLHTKEFARLRMGIGRPENKDDIVNFVLSEFTPQEKKTLKGFVKEAKDCCLLWLKEGNEKVMNEFNAKENK